MDGFIENLQLLNRQERFHLLAAAFDKPTLTVFNKMDVYEERTFDEWLDPAAKKEILKDLEERWQFLSFHGKL